MTSLRQLPRRLAGRLTGSNRLIAIDPGSSSIKLLLVESTRGRVTLLRRELIDLQAEGVMAPEEIQRHLQTVLDEMERQPIALNLPQHLAVSQVIDLPPSDAGEVRTLIEQETVKLSGLSETAIVYDYVRLKPFGRHQNPFWVTLCREEEILRQITRLQLNGEVLCEITTGANALMAAYKGAHPDPDKVVLVEVGSSNTFLLAFLDGQGVFASTLAVGGDLFTETVVNHSSWAFQDAETAKRTTNLFTGPDSVEALSQIVDRWRFELERLLTEWLSQNPELGLSLKDLSIVLCGGGALQPGLILFLKERSGFDYRAWPDMANPSEEMPGAEFTIAFGTALQALGRNEQAASLLPAEFKTVWKKHRALELLQTVTLALILLVGLLLGVATAAEARLWNRKSALLIQAQSALAIANESASSNRKLTADYERVRPVLERQKQTVDCLKTLALLDQARTNRNFWFVLFADQETYFTAPQVGQTNPPASTATNAVELPARALETNSIPFKLGFVAELFIPEGEGEARRRTLSQVVTELKGSDIFRNVDALPPDGRRALVNPKIGPPERVFPLELDLAESVFHRAREHGSALTPPTAAKAGVRLSAPRFEGGGNGSANGNGRVIRDP